MKEMAGAQDLFGTLTISDYLFQKSLIFAGNNLHGDELKLYRMLFDIIYPNLKKPELVLYLYSDVSTLLRNIRKRGRSYEQNIKGEYLEGIQQAYLEYFRQGQLQRVVLVRTDKMNFVDNYFDFERMVELLSADFEPGVHYV